MEIKKPKNFRDILSLQKYLDNAHITDYNVSDIRQAVIQIRQTKLPDPAKQPNSGSFFKNAIVTKQKLEQLLANYPNAPYYDIGNNQYKRNSLGSG